MKITGIILLVIGALVLAYQGFTYSAPHQDAKIGSLEIQHNEQHTVWFPPVVGGVLIVAGGVLLVAGTTRSINR